MMAINRRKFLQGSAAMFCAPAIVKSVMPIWVPPEKRILTRSFEVLSTDRDQSVFSLRIIGENLIVTGDQRQQLHFKLTNSDVVVGDIIKV